tara:strand:- start:531 stop:2465 length:1935 start_codon:yes stop_codon:yes gene_type:complete
MANKDFKDYAIAGSNVTLTYDDINDTVTFAAQGNVQSVNAKTGVVVINKTDVGLSAVDNTSDINKPISSATQTALNAKQDTLISATNIKTINSNSVLGSGDVVIDKTSIGLSNVANVDTTNASNISSGSLSDSRLSANVTIQGNTFNAASKLVQLDATAKLPAVDGSQLTNLPTFSAPNGLLRLSSAISTTLQTVTDYLNNVSVLQLNSRRIGILSDSSVTTQTSSVIQSSTANANLVIAPNGTGALVASIPDGTSVGGNARGNGTVDLQLNRSAANQVGAGPYNVIMGYRNAALGTFSIAMGESCISNDTATVAMGSGTTAGAQYAIAFGRSNINSGQQGTISGGQSNQITASSWGTISGGQSNTASTNTHATVVGGQSNTASGQYSTVLGGLGNTSSAQASIAGGIRSTASSTWAIALGYESLANQLMSIALGREAYAIGTNSIAIGGNNPAALASSCIAIGESSVARKINSVALGKTSNSYLFNQLATLGGTYSQASDLKAFRESTLTTGATTVLSLDGTGITELIIPYTNNTAWNVQVNWVAVVTTITGTATGITVGDVVTSIDLLAFKKIGGVSSASAHTSAATKTMVTTPAAYAACAIAFTAGASQEMSLTFTGPTFVGGGSVTMRVVARVELTEVAF